MKRKLIILGLGNVLLGDEGFGVHFVRWFEKRHSLPPGVEVVDGGTLGYGLLPVLTECEKAVVIDAIRLDDEPGSVYRFGREEMALYMPPPTSAHEVEFAHVLCQADLMGEEPEVFFLCIVPKSWGNLDLEMTPLMEEKFPLFERLLLEELGRQGIVPEERRHA